MAQDGSLEVEWKGVAFPYLLHHPNSFLKTEYYGSQKQQAAGGAHGHGHPQQRGGSDVVAPAGTGTWNGPAPRGYLGSDGQPAATAAAARPAAPVREPQHALLSSGAKIPMIGYGTYRVESADVIRQALDVGYRHFDCAAGYGNQAVVGEGLREFIAGGRRDQLFIVSKIWQTEHRPADARASVLRSLEELGCGQLDLVLVHWPEAWLPGSDIKGAVTPDPEVTLQQTWEALEGLVDEGLVRGLGLSNASLAQVEALLVAGRHWPLVNQVELHPLLAQRKLVGVSYRKGVVSVAHSCLGRLSSAGSGSPADGDLVTHPTLLRLAAECGKTPAQVLIKYNLQRGVPALVKASSRGHMEENLSGMFDWRLTNDQKAALDALDCGRRFIDFPWKDWGNVEEGGAAKPSKVLA